MDAINVAKVENSIITIQNIFVGYILYLDTAQNIRSKKIKHYSPGIDREDKLQTNDYKITQRVRLQQHVCKEYVKYV